MSNERITTKSTKNRTGDAIITVYVDDVEHFRWCDDANFDIPEDLTWPNLIKDVFNSGVEAGKLVSTSSAQSSAQEVVDETNKLAREFYQLQACEVPEGHRFDKSDHPLEETLWEMAVTAQETLKKIDVYDALSELEE